MKKYLIVLIILISLIIPTQAFALINGEIYGGYSFEGEAEIEDSDTFSVQGFGYGARLHFYNTFAIIGYGIGGFAQKSPLEGEIKIGSDKEDIDFNKTNYGIDGFVNLAIPLIPVHPYVRGGISIYETIETEFEVSGSTETETEKNYFQSYYGGFGLSFKVLPLPILSVEIFAEYLYEYSILQDSGGEFKGHRVNFGALARI